MLPVTSSFEIFDILVLYKLDYDDDDDDDYYYYYLFFYPR